ncbi:MAG: TetR/AcrR family transcriptional regulator [Ilumatobacteraceae bacterium]
MEVTGPHHQPSDPSPAPPSDSEGVEAEKQASVDGRSLRRERNQEAVIVALLELIREGNLDPATTDIADRAGVSHRSVFRYFDDLDDLVRQAIEHEIADAVSLAALPNLGEGPLPRRIESLIDSRMRVYNHTQLVAQVARARALSIPAVDVGMKGISQLFRDQLGEHFVSELAHLEPGHRSDLLDAIQLAINFESFDYNRRRFDRDDATIRRSWRIALTALLTTNPPAGVAS